MSAYECFFNVPRIDILLYILKNEGIWYSELQRHFNISKGTLTYHLDEIRRHNFLREEKMGNMVHFYIADDKVGLVKKLEELSDEFRKCSDN